MQRDRLDPDHDRDQADGDRLDQAGRDHDPLPVVAIDVDAGEQADDEARDRRDHQRQADGERRFGRPPDEDPGRQVGQRRARGRDELGEPEQREVASPEDREHGRRGGDGDGHRSLQQGVPARLARSLSGRSGDRDAFAQQQLALERELLLAAAPGVAAVAADGPVGGDHPVARDEQADRIPADRATDRPSRARGADPPSDLAIADRRAPRDVRDGGEDVPVPGRPVAEVERRTSASRAGPPGAPRGRRSRWPDGRVADRRRRASPAGSIGATPLRARAVSNAVSVVPQATATTPRSLAAMRNGPHGPGIEVRTAGRSGIAGSVAQARATPRGPYTRAMHEHTAPATASADPRDLTGPFHHTVEVQVRFADTDAMRHVNNAKYLTYCEIARIRYWTDVTGESFALGDEGAESLILAEARITYRAQAFYGEIVTVQTRATRIGRSSFTLEHRLVAGVPAARPGWSRSASRSSSASTTASSRRSRCRPSASRRSRRSRAAPSGDGAEDRHRVLATEAEAVDRDRLDLRLARDERDVVEVAFGVGRVQVRGRRDDLVADRADRGQRGGDPGGPDEVADHRLRRADRDLVGVVAVGRLDRPRLGRRR